MNTFEKIAEDKFNGDMKKACSFIVTYFPHWCYGTMRDEITLDPATRRKIFDKAIDKKIHNDFTRDFNGISDDDIKEPDSEFFRKIKSDLRKSILLWVISIVVGIAALVIDEGTATNSLVAGMLGISGVGTTMLSVTIGTLSVRYSVYKKQAANYQLAKEIMEEYNLNEYKLRYEKKLRKRPEWRHI